MPLRWACAARVGVAIVALLLAWGSRQPAPGHAQVLGPIPLGAGCTPVLLRFPVGTPITTVVDAIQPADAVRGLFQLDAATGRFRAFAPTAPATVNDLQIITVVSQPVVICLWVPGTLLPFFATVPLLVPVGPGLIAAPSTLVRGETAEVQIGTLPGYACVGAVNIPTNGPAQLPGTIIRQVRIETAAAPSGIAVIRVATAPDDRPGIMQLGVRCADGQVIRVAIQLL